MTEKTESGSGAGPGKAETPQKTPKSGAAEAARLRDDIDSGSTGEKVAFSDPAAAPLGTDAEAGGAAPRPEAAAEARRREADASAPREPQPTPAERQAPAIPGARRVMIIAAAALLVLLALWALN